MFDVLPRRRSAFPLTGSHSTRSSHLCHWINAGRESAQSTFTIECMREAARGSLLKLR